MGIELVVCRFKGLATRSVAVLLCGMGSCDLLPSDGPNANGVVARASEVRKADPSSVMRFALVTIDPRIAKNAEQYYQPVNSTIPLAFKRPGKFGLVGIGDVLSITIWEAADVGLLAKDRKAADFTVRVDVDGTISVPYAGRFAVNGRRMSDVERDIVTRLASQAVQPQVAVVIADNSSSSAFVQGDVAKPGPYRVDRPNQRVLDLIALAGGAKYPTNETSLRLTRGTATMVLPMEDVMEQPTLFNVPVAAGDSLLLLRKPMKFLALGAVAQPGEQVFRKSTLNLSEGLGQVLGLDHSRSDAKGVYLFRREPIELARKYGVQLLAEDLETVPIVYQIDLKNPQSFFVMNSFPLRPNDIVFVSTAPLAEAARFFQILSGATATVAIPRTLGGNFPAGN